MHVTLQLMNQWCADQFLKYRYQQCWHYSQGIIYAHKNFKYDKRHMLCSHLIPFFFKGLISVLIKNRNNNYLLDRVLSGRVPFEACIYHPFLLRLPVVPQQLLYPNSSTAINSSSLPSPPPSSNANVVFMSTTSSSTPPRSDSSPLNHDIQSSTQSQRQNLLWRFSIYQKADQWNDGNPTIHLMMMNPFLS